MPIPTGLNLWHFLVVNYAVCTVVLMAGAPGSTSGSISPKIWLLGIFVGCMYVVCLWLFDKAMTAGGLALSTTLMRLSAAIPTLGSLIFYAEKAHGLSDNRHCPCIFLPAPGEPGTIVSAECARNAWHGMIWGTLLFIAYGVTDFSFKVMAEMEPLADPKAFMVPIFATALLVTLPTLLKQGKPDKPCLLWGTLLGATNVLTTYFWFKALALIPGSIAFPTLGLGVIAITTLAGLTIWHEKLRPANVAFLALACIAVLLINS